MNVRSMRLSLAFLFEKAFEVEDAHAQGKMLVTRRSQAPKRKIRVLEWHKGAGWPKKSCGAKLSPTRPVWGPIRIGTSPLSSRTTP
jgi:hypothetical protein